MSDIDLLSQFRLKVFFVREKSLLKTGIDKLNMFEIFKTPKLKHLQHFYCKGCHKTHEIDKFIKIMILEWEN